MIKFKNTSANEIELKIVYEDFFGKKLAILTATNNKVVSVPLLAIDSEADLVLFKDLPESLGLNVTKSGSLKIYDFENVSKDYYDEHEKCNVCGEIHK